MNPKEKILRTELVSAGAALLCCLLLCIACFLLAGLPSASLILLAAALPLSLVILPCALTWYSGRFCWAAPIFLTLGFILIPSYFLRGYFLEIGLAGLASGLFAAAVQGFHLAARREMPCTAWAAYGGLTVLYLFVSLLDLLHDALFTGGPMAGIWIAATVCCLGITLLVFRAGRRVTFYPAAWMVVLFALQFGMTYWTLPFDLGRAALHFAVVLVPQLLLTLVLLLRRPRAVLASEVELRRCAIFPAERWADKTKRRSGRLALLCPDAGICGSLNCA